MSKTLKERAKPVIEMLIQYNKWRRWDRDVPMEMPNPKELGVRIDEAVVLIKDQQARIEELESMINQEDEFAGIDEFNSNR